MKTETTKQWKNRLQLTFAVGRIVPHKRAQLLQLAKRAESLQRQISRRSIELDTLKQQLKPSVQYGYTTLGNYRIYKGHVKAHHIKPHFCKAYDTLNVSRL